MRGVACEQVGPQHDQADTRLRADLQPRQLRRVRADATGQTRMIDADLGVLQRWLDLQPLRRPAAPIGVAVHQQPHHVRRVLLGPGEPVLQREEIGPEVLRRSGDEAQQLGQPAQHRHLPRAGGLRLAGLLIGLAAQALEERERAAALLAHPQLAHARQPHDLGRGHAADHGVAIVAPRLQVRQHHLDVLVHEHHRHDDDVPRGDIGPGASQRRRILSELGRRMERHAKARDLAPERRESPVRRARHMAVQRDDDDVQFRAVSGHNAPSLRTAYRR